MAVLIFNKTESFTNDRNFINDLSITNSINSSNASSILKGCWSQFYSELNDCNIDDICIANSRHTGYKDSLAMFCCCKTHKCNKNVSFQIELPSTTCIFYKFFEYAFKSMLV